MLQHQDTGVYEAGITTSWVQIVTGNSHIARDGLYSCCVGMMSWCIDASTHHPNMTSCHHDTNMMTWCSHDVLMMHYPWSRDDQYMNSILLMLGSYKGIQHNYCSVLARDVHALIQGTWATDDAQLMRACCAHELCIDASMHRCIDASTHHHIMYSTC